jgi:hemolysin III
MAAGGFLRSMYQGERINSISHLIGASLALAGMAVLVVQASLQGDPWKIVSFSIYGATLSGLYLFSTLYHSVRGKTKTVFQKIDHGAIYLLIAGSYTPFALVTLRGAWGWSIFGVIWGLAFFGIIQDIVITQGKRILSLAIYLLMGWLALVAIRPLTQALPGAGLVLLVLGGICYTVGVVFYVLDQKISHGHEIFHFFVLAGSAFHYFTILLYIS